MSVRNIVKIFSNHILFKATKDVEDTDKTRRRMCKQKINVSVLTIRRFKHQNILSISKLPSSNTPFTLCLE